MDRIFKTIIFIFLILTSEGLSSESLIFDLSEREIEISKKNKSPDFTIFGFTNSESSLVLKIKGPSQKVILQKKNKVVGMWSWNKTGNCYPGLFHYYTNKNDDEIV